VGYNYGGTITASFWDTETSGQVTSDGGTGLSTIEMQTLSTFIDAGWDFVGETANGTDDIWKMPAGDYPRLSWEETAEENACSLAVYSSGVSSVVISSSTGHGGTTTYTKMVSEGAAITLTAPLRSGDARFIGWTGLVNCMNQTISFIMDDDISVTANYETVDQSEGCTPGFWKNHPNCWSAAYSEDMLISDVFAALKATPYDSIDDGDRKSDFENDRMADALRYRGGPALAGSVRNMLRHATAALLNAGNDAMAYPVPQEIIIDLVNYVLDQGDTAKVQELHTILVDLNEDSPCPINAHCQRFDDIDRR
jgi:hypothetical protein